MHEIRCLHCGIWEMSECKCALKNTSADSNMTDKEIKILLIQAIMEIQKINKHLDKLLEEKPVKINLQEYNLRPPYTIT